MIKSLQHLLDSLKQDSQPFDNPDDAVLQSSLAAILYHLIEADGVVTRRERATFGHILHEQLGLDAQRCDQLFEQASSSAGDLLADMATVSTHLKDSPTLRLSFVRALTRLMNVDGVAEDELTVVRDAIAKVFPDVRVP